MLRNFEHGVVVNNSRSGPRRLESWRGDDIVFTRMRFACDDAVYEGCCSHHLIVLTLSGTSAETVSEYTGRRTYRGRDHPGALSFTPAEMERRCYYRRPDLAFAGLWVLPSFVEALSERRLDLEAAAVTNGDDAHVAALLRWLSDEVTADGAPDVLFAENLASLALLRLARGTTATARRSSLAPRIVRAVEDFVDAHLHDEIAVSDLAALAEMPLDTFARHFRETVGLAPYAFVVERRLDRAEKLLAAGGDSIAAIAVKCGFSSQSHLTRTFAKRRGTTPARWRANFAPET